MIEEVKKILPELRGDLENFAKDTVEYFQKTGLVCPSNLPLTVERIAKRLDKICQLFEPKGDDEGLLTREGVRQLGLSDVRLLDSNEIKLLKAQRDLTRRECQEKIDQMLEVIAGHLGFNLVEPEDLPEWWQALKEGVK